jgi:hypothetical protein
VFVYAERRSRKFETLFISCERNIADGRSCQSHRKKGRVQIVQAVPSLRSVQVVEDGKNGSSCSNRFSGLKSRRWCELWRTDWQNARSLRTAKNQIAGKASHGNAEKADSAFALRESGEDYHNDCAGNTSF